VIDTPVIETFDSEEADDLLTRKTGAYEIASRGLGWDLMLSFHDNPPVSLGRLLQRRHMVQQ
jgi:hypothetical protein